MQRRFVAAENIVSAAPEGWRAIHLCLITAAHAMSNGRSGPAALARLAVGVAHRTGYRSLADERRTRFVGSGIARWQTHLYAVNELKDWRFPDPILLVGWLVEWIEGRNDLVEGVENSPLIHPPAPTGTPAFGDILSSPPEPGRAAKPSMTPVATRVDFLRLDAENRALGTRGEEFVFDLERRRLHDEERRPDLAKQVRWRARDDGDGLGYDILSFERGGSKRQIFSLRADAQRARVLATRDGALPTLPAV